MGLPSGDDLGRNMMEQAGLDAKQEAMILREKVERLEIRVQELERQLNSVKMERI